MNRIKKNDDVLVLTGKNKGKIAKVLQVIPKSKKVIVEKVNLVKRHTKPSQKNTGGIIEKEKPIDWSNVMLVCKYCKKPSKVGFEVVSGKKSRKCSSCGELIDK